jgi:hypothetical protein
MDWGNKHITEDTGSTVSVSCQEIIDYVRAQEASQQGITFDQIIDGSGKQSLGGSVSVGITIELLDDWQMKFAPGSDYVATISGGNLVGGLSGDPVAYTSGMQVLILQSAASTTVAVGSGVTQQDKDDIIEGVWDEAEPEIIRKILENKVTKSGDIITIYEDDDTTPWRQYDLSSGGRVEQ